jgi:hypothetical protein
VLPPSGANAAAPRRMPWHTSVITPRHFLARVVYRERIELLGRADVRREWRVTGVTEARRHPSVSSIHIGDSLN